MITNETLESLIDFNLEPFKSMLHPDHPEKSKNMIRYILYKYRNGDMVNGHIAISEEEFEEFVKDYPKDIV